MLDSRDHFGPDCAQEAQRHHHTQKVRSTATRGDGLLTEQAETFLAVLGKDPATTRLRAFPHKESTNRAEIGARKGRWDLEQAAAWNRQGRGVYVVTGNGGDKKQDITSCPALFVEWDDQPIKWQLTAWIELGLPEPSMQVRTGGRSVHNWWVMAEPISPADFEALQIRLYTHCKSDELKDPSRVMRLPGFAYIGPDDKPAGMVELVNVTGNRYTAANFEACLPAIKAKPAPEQGPEAFRAFELLPGGLVDDLPPRSIEAISEAARFIPRRVGGDKTYFADRNALCGCSAALAEAGQPDPDGAALALLGHLWPDEGAAAQVLGSTTTRLAASFWAIAKEHGYDTRRHDLKGHRPKPQRNTNQWPDQQQEQQQQQEKPQPYRVLGWNADRTKVWYRHRQTAQIANAKPFGSQELLRLAPLDHWYDKHPKTNKEGEVIAVNWAQAASDLIQDADACGVFEIERVKGRGVWLDGGKVVWHLGDKLEVDGVLTPLADHKSDNHYGLMASLPIDPAIEPLSDDHGKAILQVLKDCGWQGPSDHLHLAGFTVISNVSGGVPKRPGLQVTSPFGSGKTDTIENGIDPLQGGLGKITTGSTEAGLRQLIGRDALPATVDESEAEDGRKREAMLRCLRYNFDGNEVVKGTPSGEPIKFCMRSGICLAGINSPITNPADRSRIAVISRQLLPSEEWTGVAKRRANLITTEVGKQLIRRSVSNLPALLDNITTFGRVIADMVDSGDSGRAGDTWGALLAGAHHLTSTKRVSDEEAKAWLAEVGWDISHTESDETDRKAGAEGRQCLDQMLSHEIRWIDPGDRESGRPSTGFLAIRELVSLVKNSPQSIDGQEAEKELGRKGLRVLTEGLAVANNAPGTQAIFKATKWANGAHKDRFLELKGTTRASGPLHFPGSGSRRAVLLAWSDVGPLGDVEPVPAAAAQEPDQSPAPASEPTRSKLIRDYIEVALGEGLADVKLQLRVQNLAIDNGIDPYPNGHEINKELKAMGR